MKEIRSEIEVSAPADRVWNVLAQFQRYGEWNPFIYRISGEPRAGERISINLRTPSGKERSYQPVVTRFEPPRELRWVGKSLFLEGEHVFMLETAKPGITRLVHFEVFKGLLSRFFGESAEKDIHGGFSQMNEALKRRVELDVKPHG
jgi:hypothetical protein